MKKLFLLLVLLCLTGCDDTFYSYGSATAAVYGRNGHYACRIVQTGGGDRVYLGEFQSATAADTYCIQINDLLKKAPAPPITVRAPINNGMNDAAAAAAAGAIAVSR